VSGLIVVDVGNSRIKWGRCEDGGVVEAVALPPDSPNAWQMQLDCWPNAMTCAWAVSGVHPQCRDALVAWLRSRVAGVQVIDSYRQLPLAVRVDEPEKVGIDRLLNAVAANTRRPPGSPAVIVDAGSAVTVDLVYGAGDFRGGAIFPGLRLMARALHEHTALLPLVDFDQVEQAPASSTVAAIRAGIFSAVRGGIWRLVCRYVECADANAAMPVYVTGGDAALLVSVDPTLGELWPEMTLHGIFHSVAGRSAHG
jgi:type III pantothenate kinase